MKTLVFGLALLALGAAATTSAQEGARTVWDGVYTTEQATKGEKIYAQACAHCHGDTLLGGEGPALVGPAFAANWDNVALSDLLDRIRATMPADNPGNLSRLDTTDLIAHMLKAGAFPAGPAALSSEAGALAQIKFVSIRPQK